MRNFLRVLTALIFFLTASSHSESAVRLGVTTFQSGSGSMNTGQLEIITDSFINTIAGSRAIAVLERSRFDAIAREQKMSLSGLVDTETAVKIGKLSGCNYIITGSVYIQDEANIAVRVVDVSTGQIYFSMSETSQSPQISSLISAASLLGNRVREEIAGEYAYVSEVRGRSIHISRGSKDGVHRGDLYRVYVDGAEVLDTEGKSLGRDVIDIAIVRIKDARPNFSIAEIVKNGGRAEDIKRGSKVENISDEYANELISSGIFAAKRTVKKITEKPLTNRDNKASSQPKLNMKPKTIKQEEADELYEQGVNYHLGLGVKQNYSEAVKRFRKAADYEHARAQTALGFMYYKGEGVKQDYAEAVKWYRKAAEQGNADAQCSLGFMYYDGKGVKLDYAEAMKWLHKAAEQEHTVAQNQLGAMYHTGEGVKRDYGEAVKWFSKAAEHGYAAAQNNLGFMYLTGYGVKRDYREAVKWFSKAADQKHTEAQVFLGHMYENGYGVKKDLRKAIELYREAAKQGNKSAREALKRLGAD